jgi:hypothetical protein
MNTGITAIHGEGTQAERAPAGLLRSPLDGYVDLLSDDGVAGIPSILLFKIVHEYIKRGDF